MAELQYLRIEGETEIYDVVRDGKMLGLVWQRAGAWYADRYSMLGPEICGATRDEVAVKLDPARTSRLTPWR
jgi:hypothetical protein